MSQIFSALRLLGLCLPSSARPAFSCVILLEDFPLRLAFHPLKRTIGSVILILSLAPSIGGAHAQTPPTPTTDSTASISTLSGVYSAEQASRGKDIYANLCKSCHNPSVGDAFAKRWAGKTLLDMFTYIYENMPDNNPKSVDEATDADIIGYLMQSTGMPVGTRDVPIVPDSLKLIRIEIKKDTSAVKKDTSSAVKPPSGAAAHSRSHRSTS
jgi:cytochrome c5